MAANPLFPTRRLVMNVKIENGELVIRIKMKDPPRPSKSGKTLLVATSGGIAKTDVTVDGKQLSIGLNAFVPK
jgi:hypothetical protein